MQELDPEREWDRLIDEIKSRNAGRPQEEIETIIDEALAWARQPNQQRLS